MKKIFGNIPVIPFAIFMIIAVAGIILSVQMPTVSIYQPMAAEIVVLDEPENNSELDPSSTIDFSWTPTNFVDPYTNCSLNIFTGYGWAQVPGSGELIDCSADDQCTITVPSNHPNLDLGLVWPVGAYRWKVACTGHPAKWSEEWRFDVVAAGPLPDLTILDASIEPNSVSYVTIKNIGEAESSTNQLKADWTQQTSCPAGTDGVWQPSDVPGVPGYYECWVFRDVPELDSDDETTIDIGSGLQDRSVTITVDSEKETIESDETNNMLTKNLVLAVVCSESDNGYYLNVKGNCINATGIYEDYCKEERVEGGWGVPDTYVTYLHEYRCSGTVCVDTKASCAFKYICVDGACEIEDTCTPAGGYCSVLPCVANYVSDSTKRCPDSMGFSQKCCMPATHTECQNRKCVVVQGLGTDECTTDANCRGGGSSGGTRTCKENWTLIQDWTPAVCNASRLQTKTWQDMNNCNTTSTLNITCTLQGNKCIQTRACIPPCTENWQCTDWSDCTPEGKQYRSCIDQNKCGTTVSKPAESEDCAYIPFCAELEGTICSEDNEICEGELVSAADTAYCCIGKCSKKGVPISATTWIIIGLGVLIAAIVVFLLAKRPKKPAALPVAKEQKKPAFKELEETEI